MEVEGGGRGAPLQHCHVKVHAMEIQTVLLMNDLDPMYGALCIQSMGDYILLPLYFLLHE